MSAVQGGHTADETGELTDASSQAKRKICMVSWILKKILGSKNQRELKRLWPLVHRVNEIEAEYQRFSDEQLRARTDEFRKRIADGAPIDDILPEAFAAVKNTCRRLLGKEWLVRGRPYK